MIEALEHDFEYLTDTTRLSRIGDMVRRLTVDTTRTVDGREVTAGALLDQIRAAIHSGTGRTHGGHASPNERSPLDMAAFERFEDLDGQIASLFVSATDLPRHPTAEENVTGWWEEFQAAHARGEIVAAQIDVAYRRVGGWVRRIEDYFEPPTVKEITHACPRCGERYFYACEARVPVRRSALYVEVRPGKPMEGFCRSCGAEWVGEGRLQQLGRAIRMPVVV